jgi:hypothetical protein
MVWSLFDFGEDPSETRLGICSRYKFAAPITKLSHKPIYWCAGFSGPQSGIERVPKFVAHKKVMRVHLA